MPGEALRWGCNYPSFMDLTASLIEGKVKLSNIFRNLLT